jgi:hypothetical protein
MENSQDEIYSAAIRSRAGEFLSRPSGKFPFYAV